jgi:hypothetical protein
MPAHGPVVLDHLTKLRQSIDDFQRRNSLDPRVDNFKVPIQLRPTRPSHRSRSNRHVRSMAEPMSTAV